MIVVLNMILSTIIMILILFIISIFISVSLKGPGPAAGAEGPASLPQRAPAEQRAGGRRRGVEQVYVFMYYELLFNYASFNW